MKKRLRVLCCLVCATSVLSACSISTPVGTLSFDFDETKKSEQTIIRDDNGNETVINAVSVKAYLDQLLSSVTLPDGTSSSELSSFIYSTLDDLGIDLDTIDSLTGAELKDVESAIEETLENSGVDTSNLDLDIIDFLEGGLNE